MATPDYEVDLMDLIKQEREAEIDREDRLSRQRVSDPDALRYALGRAGTLGLTHQGMCEAIHSPNAARRFRELQQRGEAEKYPAGRTERGRTLFRYRLCALNHKEE